MVKNPPAKTNRIKNGKKKKKKNLPAIAGDTGWIPGPGRFHMLQSNWARVPLLSPRSKPTATSTEPGCREPALNKGSQGRKELMHRNQESLCQLQLEKARPMQPRPSAAKSKQIPITKKKPWKERFSEDQLLPIWRGPYKVIWTTPTAVKEQGTSSWVHLSRISFYLQKLHRSQQKNHHL